jgi:hypothetical protein
MAEKESSGLVTSLSVIGIVFGLIGMMGSFIPCIGSLAFYIGIPAAIVSFVALIVASNKYYNTFAIVALTISLIGVVISGWQYFSIISAGEQARRALMNMNKPSTQSSSRPIPQPMPSARESTPQQTSSVARNEIQPTRELFENEAKELVKTFYSNRGEWAGVFTIEDIDKIRMEAYHPGQIGVHVKYQFKAIPGNPRGRTDSGIDQRIFDVKWNGNTYEVTGMRGYNSAIF